MTNKFYTFHDSFGDFGYSNDRADIDFTVYSHVTTPGVLARVENYRKETIQIFIPKEDWPEFVKSINSIKFDQRVSGKPSEQSYRQT